MLPLPGTIQFGAHTIPFEGPLSLAFGSLDPTIVIVWKELPRTDGINQQNAKYFHCRTDERAQALFQELVDKHQAQRQQPRRIIDGKHFLLEE